MKWIHTLYYCRFAIFLVFWPSEFFLFLHLPQRLIFRCTKRKYAGGKNNLMINEFRYMSRNGGREKHCTVWDGIYQMLDGKRKERKTATTTNPIRFHFIRLVSCFIMHRSVRLIVNEMKLLLFFTVKQNSHRCWVIKVAVVRYWMTKMHLKAKIDSLGWQKCVIYLIYYSFSQTRLQRALSLTELRCLNFYLTTWLVYAAVVVLHTGKCKPTKRLLKEAGSSKTDCAAYTHKKKRKEKK